MFLSAPKLLYYGLSTQNSVFLMEVDSQNPNIILFVDSYCLKTTDGTIITLEVGSSTEYGYVEGVGTSARFISLLGFTQISDTVIILVDYLSHCLRQLDRLTMQTSMFAGHCLIEGHQNGSNSLFKLPRFIYKDPRSTNHLFVAELGPNLR